MIIQNFLENFNITHDNRKAIFYFITKKHENKHQKIVEKSVDNYVYNFLQYTHHPGENRKAWKTNHFSCMFKKLFH